VKRFAGRMPGQAQGPVRFERILVKLPPWPRGIASIRKDCFPARFVQTYAPMARHGSWVVAAVQGRKEVGYAQVVRYVGDNRICTLEEVAVEPRHRHLGLSTGLIFEAARWMREEGYETIHTCPLHDEDEQLRERWLWSLGFRQHGSGWRADAAELVSGAGGR